MTDSSRSELGNFLRSRREKLSPRDVDLPSGRRRRTPGLRREEVAELADIGIDWYIRLEQGRSVHPSLATIDALARALRFNKAEHVHLRALARPVERRTWSRESVPEALRRLVECLKEPAYVTGRRWDVLAWNGAAAKAIADFGRIAPEDCNILLYVLTKPAAKSLFGTTWADEAKRMVAQFRTAYDLWAGDPAFVHLVDRLRAGCPKFALWWEAHDIRSSGTAGKKSLHHPKRGLLHFEYATFQSNDDPTLKLAIYTPVELSRP